MDQKRLGYNFDVYEKIDSKAGYIKDKNFSQMLHGATIRSPLAHAKFFGIENIEELRNMPGVASVVDASDIPEQNSILYTKSDYPCLAENTIKFIGQPVGLVAADTKENALRAIKRARLKTQALSTIFESSKAIVPGAIYIGGNDNVYSSYKIRKGSVKKAFRDAFLSVEGIFYNKAQYPCCLENLEIVVSPSESGGLTIMGSIKDIYSVQKTVANVTGLKLSSVRVQAGKLSDTFGAKLESPSILAAHAAILSLKTSKPVSIVYDREEDFIAMPKRHSSRTKIKYSADRDGKITACEVEYIINGGAYATSSDEAAWRGIIHSCGCYSIENLHLDSYAVATNMAPAGLMEIAGQAQVNFANESLIDELAEALNMHPVEIRKKNMLKTGLQTATGQIIGESCALQECLDRCVDKIRFKRHRASDSSKIKKGMGISTVFYGAGRGAKGQYYEKASAYVDIKEDSSVIVAVGCVNSGNAVNSFFAKIVSDILSCDISLVKIVNADTSLISSSSPDNIIIIGRAVQEASEKLKNNLKQVASVILDAEIEEIESEKGIYRSYRDNITYKDLVRKAYEERIKMSEIAWFKADNLDFNTSDGMGNVYPVYSFAANVCELEINTETAEIKLIRFVAAHDVGKAICKKSIGNNISASLMQGIGYALYENICFEEGKILNPSFLEYSIPGSLDVCDIENIIVESPYWEGPLGLKSFGEASIAGVAPAIANAIYDAVGVRMYSTPFLSEQLFNEIKNKF